MDSIYFLINDKQEVEIVKVRHFPATDTKPSRAKITPTNLDGESLGKSIWIGLSGRPTGDAIEIAKPGWSVVSTGTITKAIESHFKATAYVAVVECGRGYEKTRQILYSGPNEHEAKVKIDLYDFVSPWNQCGYIDKWVNGKLVSTTEIDVK